MELRIANRPARVYSLAVVFGFAFLVSGTVRAQTPSEVERAEVLFNEARGLMDGGNFAEACAKFAASEALDPGGGTILNLGICRQREGKTATAFEVLGQALATARANGRSDRIATAEKHLAELAPLLSRLTVELWEGAPADVSIEVDGAVLAPALVGHPMALDPGVHRLRVTEPSHESWTGELTLTAVGDAQSVKVPPLQATTPAPSAAAVVLPPPVPRPMPAPPTPPLPPPAARSHDWLGIGLVSAGGVALAAGAYMGVRAMSLRSQSNRYFDGSHCIQDSCRSDWESAKTSALISDLGFGVGALAVGLGSYLLLRPQEHAPSAARRPTLALSVGASGARAEVLTSF
jgi:hypothetical protein